MSFDLFKRVISRDSEFKGQNADVEKYYKKRSALATPIAFLILVTIFLVCYFLFT